MPEATNSTVVLARAVKRIEQLENDRGNLAADIKEIYAELKNAGFDVKTVRKLIAERRRDADDIEEEKLLLETYRRALGAYVETPLGEAAVRRAVANSPAFACPDLDQSDYPPARDDFLPPIA